MEWAGDNMSKRDGSDYTIWDNWKPGCQSLVIVDQATVSGLWHLQMNKVSVYESDYVGGVRKKP